MKIAKQILALSLTVCVLAGIVSTAGFAASGEEYTETGQEESTEESSVKTEETDDTVITIDTGIATDCAEQLTTEEAAEMESEAESAISEAETIETEESTTTTEEATEEAEEVSEEETVAEEDETYSAKNFVNYYLMSGDSEYLELPEAVPYVYAEVNHDNYEQIVFSAMDWNNLSEEDQSEVDAILTEVAGMTYLEFLQEAVFYTLDEEDGVVGASCYAVQYDEDMNIIESTGKVDGIEVAAIISDAGLSDVILSVRPMLMMASFSGNFATQSKLNYSYGTWGNAYVYRGTTTGTLGLIYVSSPFGDVSATTISGTLHVGYFYSGWMDAYYYSYCMSARSAYPKDKWIRSDGEAKWNNLSEWQRVGLAKALMYGEYYRSQNGGDGAYSAVQCVVWSIMHQQMDQYGRGTGNIYDGMHLYSAYYDDCWTTFAKIRDAMWIHGEKPSFTYDTSDTANANPVALTYNTGTGKYTATLTDTSSCKSSTWYSGSTYLHDYFTFTAVDDSGNAIDGITFSVSGANLTITATKEALAKADVITVKVLTPTRTGTTYISIYDSIRYLGVGWQPIITNWEDEGSPTYVYMSIKGAPKDPKIDTSAADSETGNSFSLADNSATIVDTVAYENLEEGQSYTVTGTLMNKATGQTVTVNGKILTASKTFTPSASDGTVKVNFTFDGATLAGKTLVVFEKLYLDGKEITQHEDLSDGGQTIYLPKLSTTALDSDTGTHEALADDAVTILDTVTYDNLIPGKSYTITGTLMDKSGGSSLKVNNKVVTVTKTFTPSYATGSITMKFTFDGSACYGKDIVVYETLSYDGNIIAEHKDLSDASQTITMSPAATLIIQKYDAGSSPMSGVTFALTDKNGKSVKDAGGSTVKNLTADSTGTVKFTNLPYGDYLLTELSTKDGYSLLKDSIAVSFPYPMTGQVDMENALYDKTHDTTYLFTQSYEIHNGEIYTLPAAGSTGFTLAAFGMTVLGLTLAAGLFYIITYERKHRK